MEENFLHPPLVASLPHSSLERHWFGCGEAATVNDMTNRSDIKLDKDRGLRLRPSENFNGIQDLAGFDEIAGVPFAHFGAPFNRKLCYPA